MMDAYPQMVRPKRSFLSTLAWGVSSTVIVIILSLAAIILYGMNIADRKADTLAGLAESGLRNMPELCRALPPALADLLTDERRPDYRDQIEVTARLVPAPAQDWSRGYRDRRDDRPYVQPVIEVRNRGKELVSLLSLRVVILNEDNVPVAESNAWAATPIAADHDWRGPLMPGTTAHILGKCVPIQGGGSADKLHVEVAISDIRVWNRAAPPPPPPSPADASGRPEPRSTGTPRLPEPPDAPRPPRPLKPERPEETP